MKKIELLHFTVAKNMSVNCLTLSSSCHFFCHLLESGLARINWIRAVDKFCVEQLICCQKCRANDCRAIAFWAVHPHSNDTFVLHLRYLYFQSFGPLKNKVGWTFASKFESRVCSVKWLILHSIKMTSKMDKNFTKFSK